VRAHHRGQHRPLEECERTTADNIAGYAAFVEQLRDEGDLSRPVPYRNQHGNAYETPLLDVLTQVLTHGAYHRGQIAKCLGRAGTAAVNTDYITFQREGNGAFADRVPHESSARSS
jgi:uncharacterized damage-inducible protein DinB